MARISARVAARWVWSPICIIRFWSSVMMMPTRVRAPVLPDMALPIRLAMDTASSWVALMPFVWASRSAMPVDRVWIWSALSWKVASCCIPAMVISSPMTPTFCSCPAKSVSCVVAAWMAPVPPAAMPGTLPSRVWSFVTASICRSAASMALSAKFFMP